MSTEKTPLTSSIPNGLHYRNDYETGLFLTRRRKEKQLQCLTQLIVILIFVMALMTAISYSVHNTDSLVDNSTNPEIIPSPGTLQLKWMQQNPKLKIVNALVEHSLTTSEWQAAVKAGQEAITTRIAIDTASEPLPAPSPVSRHQYAVKTSLKAGKLALGGIGELAATRLIEKSRLQLGVPSSVGSYFKNIWVPTDTCKEFSAINCTVSKYRTFDGTCNHPRNYGAALTPFIRKIPADYADGIESPRTGKFNKPLPSAREISLKVHPPAPSSNPDFTVMLAVFGQFLDHDITATAISQGTNGTSISCCPAELHNHPECFPVKTGPGDPVFDTAKRDCMEFVRSAPAPQCKIGPRQQLNQVTSFIDGSVIYGSDGETAKSLREGRGGLLKMFVTPDNRTLLPQSTNPNDGCNRDVESVRGRYCFASGDGRANENLHLTTMHLLWSRQHNKVATELFTINPMWSDEILFQEARRIIGAQLQHITYKEFIPVILGEEDTDRRKLKPLSSGFRAQIDLNPVNPAIANSFASAAFRFAHTLLPGLMKVSDAQNGTFTYVELHRMLFNPYSLYKKGGMDSSLTTVTSNTIQKTTTHVTSQLTRHLFEDPLANATVPCGLDLVSLNIQRGRDHGLPGYIVWRQFCGLSEIKTFEDLRGELDDDALNEISKLYDQVDDIDLYTGALAEIKGSDGLIGPTFKCLIGDQFSRILKGDQFWYETPGNPQSFTEDQLKEIRKTSLAKLICDCSDEIYYIQPEVMRSVSTKNPMVSCEDLPSLNLSFWKDPQLSILEAAETSEKPEEWVNFESNIKLTIEKVIDDFVQTSVTKNVSWVEFGKWLKNSFTELKNEIMSVQSMTGRIVEKPSGVTNSERDFNEVSDESQKVETVTIKRSESTISNDWMRLKNEITTNLTDAMVNATGVPTIEQRHEILKSIITEVTKIEKMIGSIRILKNSFKNETITSADIELFKNDFIEALKSAIDRIQNGAPPPGDITWITYGNEIKNEFENVANYARILANKTVQSISTPQLNNNNAFAHQKIREIATAIDLKGENFWYKVGEYVNRSTTDAIANMIGKQLLPNGPELMATSWKIMNDLSKFEDDFAKINKMKSEQYSVSPKFPSTASFWNDFRNSLNNSIQNAFSKIAAKNLPPGDPAWTQFHSEIMNSFVKLKDQNMQFEGKNKSIISIDTIQLEKDTLLPFRWYTFKSEIISSVASMLNNTISIIPLANSTVWAQFKADIISQYKKIPSEETVKKSLGSEGARKDPNSSEKSILDWLSFKDEINKSINEIINNKLNKPFTIYNMSSMLSKSKVESFPENLAQFTDEIDDSLARSFGLNRSKVFLPKNDSSWTSFKDAIKNEFSTLRTMIAYLNANTSSQPIAGLQVPFKSVSENLKPRIKTKNRVAEKLPNSGLTKTILQSTENLDKNGTVPVIDWDGLTKKITNTVVTYVKIMNDTDVGEWKATKDLIRNSFMQLRDQIRASKNHTVGIQPNR
ncbi:uncharacterized protein [Venturia canescens]|uniref:uncharacterized protein n=1 Tax=Venturia canescens TaxID=32260 RepID=UPI001C9CC757|nr:uncharacterized protein LOC122410597 [Venturia canescens]